MQVPHPIMSIELRKMLYRYDEVAQLISLSLQSVRRLVDMGELERIYVARREPRITRESIISYVARRRHANGSLAHPT